MTNKHDILNIMNKRIVLAIIVAGILIGAAIAYEIHQSNKACEAPSGEIKCLTDKKLDGDSMTEHAVDNVMSGKKPLDGEDLPADNKPKANDLQGSGDSSNKELKGGVIIDDPIIK